MSTIDISALCNHAYERYNRLEYLSPDPLQIVLECQKSEQETVGLIAACLAMGRVGGILKAVENVLARVFSLDTESTKNFSELLASATVLDLHRVFKGFVFRFFGSDDLVAFCAGIGGVLRAYGSLESCFASPITGMLHGQIQVSDPRSLSESAVTKGLSHLVSEIRRFGGFFHPLLLSNPSSGSANKRLHLFLRWMLRKDAIDPGCWSVLPARELWMPLDTHSLRHCRALGLTSRPSADAITAQEVTNAFRRFSPEDPCRFDFALSRMGIHPDAREEESEVYARHRRKS